MRPAGTVITRRWALAVAAGGLALLAAGCTTPPERATVVRQPQTAPVRTLSSFSEALRCMDDLMWRQGKHDIFITSTGIPDATGRVAGGTKEMLITAVSRMSARSNAFRFVDFEPAMDDVNALYWLVGVQPDFRAPSYYIRGAITQLDDNVLNEAVSAGISLPKLDLSVSQDQVVSVIAVDLNVGELVTRQILPGMSASNSIAVVASGKGADAGGLINKAGVNFSVSLNRSEGFHQAVRTLIELSTIEVLGKLTRTPYWQCLGIDQTNPTFMTQAREWFDAMPPAERVTFAKRVLAAGRYYDGAMDGTVDPAMEGAVLRYQADNDLIASGRIDFDLYYHMLGRAAGPAPTAEATGAAVPVATGAVADPDVVVTTDRGPAPRYRVGEALVVRAEPTADGFLYCYYQDSQGAVARIFPNRFQPNPFVTAGRPVEIPPGAQKPFNIRMDRPGSGEAIACVVSRQELGTRLPERFKTADLQPISLAALPDLLKAFEAVPGAKVRARTMPISVIAAGS